jgi:hypothetical protein
MNEQNNNFNSIHDILKKKRITGKIYQKQGFKISDI